MVHDGRSIFPPFGDARFFLRASTPSPEICDQENPGCGLRECSVRASEIPMKIAEILGKFGPRAIKGSWMVSVA